MADLIKLMPASQVAGEGLAPGELAIDEAARLLWLDRQQGGGPESVPLDVLVVPPVTDETSESAILTLGEDGPVWQELDAGGGGYAFDQATWRIPGAIMLAYDLMDIDSALEGYFEIGEPCTATRLRVGVEAAVAEIVVMIIREGADDPVLDIVVSAEDGDFEQAVSVDFTPGRYRFVLATNATAEFQVFRGALPWEQGEMIYPFLLSFT